MAYNLHNIPVSSARCRLVAFRAEVIRPVPEFMGRAGRSFKAAIVPCRRLPREVAP